MFVSSAVPDALVRIGFNPLVARAHASLDAPPARSGRIVEVRRDRCVVHTGTGCALATALPGVAAHGALVVGDWVALSESPPGQLWIARRLPPCSEIERIDPSGRRQALVTNIDCAFLVMGLDADFNLRRLERYIALVRASGVWPVIVLTKADCCADREQRVAALSARVPQSVDRCALDATDPLQVAPLATYLPAGQTGVLLGSSGAGKSTLTNALLGMGQQATGAVRASDGRGRHTTTARQLRQLPGGGCLIDTPGLRGLRLDIGADALAYAFEDVAALAARCRFRDCRHEHEPGCAVRGAVADDRLANYRKLAREIARDSTTALERHEARASVRAQHRALRSMRRLRGR
jgi:ribosome biogenesis GTPase / thiamine phosphate phosphatase